MKKTILSKTFDSVITYDAATNLAYYVSQLENMDPKLHQPITGVTWGRDIKLRSGVSITDEEVSFQRINFGGTGTTKLDDIPWITQDTSSFAGVSISGEKVNTPIRLAGRIITYTATELEKAQRLGINLDTQKLDALHTLYQMGIDKMVYVGDSSLDTTEHKCRGLLNSDQVKMTTADKKFENMTPDEMVTAINDLIEMVWESTAYKMMPNKIILPPKVFVKLATTKYGDNADKTILTYLRENSLAAADKDGAPSNAISYVPSHWAAAAGTSGVGRIMAYVNDVERVRFSLVPIKSYTPYYDQAIRYNAPYVWAMGETEFVYPETAAYLDDAAA